MLKIRTIFFELLHANKARLRCTYSADACFSESNIFFLPKPETMDFFFFFPIHLSPSLLFPTFFLPLSILLAWWAVVFAVLVLICCCCRTGPCPSDAFSKYYRRGGRAEEQKLAKGGGGSGGGHLLTYEHLPVVYDDHCTDLTARHVYLFQLWYGERSKRFFFPSTTITISFLRKVEEGAGGGGKKEVANTAMEKEATLVLRTRLLCENHRRNLWNLPGDFARFRRQSHQEMLPTQPPMSLYVLYKRKHPLTMPPCILFDHNQHNSSVILYSVLLLQLSEEEGGCTRISSSNTGGGKPIFGSTVDRAMLCLEQMGPNGSGRNERRPPPADVLAKQTFTLAPLGRYTDPGTTASIGPSTGLSLAESLLFVLVGESVLVAVVTSLLVQCPPPGSSLHKWCRRSGAYSQQPNQQRLSKSEEVALYGAMAALVAGLALALAYVFSLKRLNARLQGVGFISVVMKAMPAVLLVFCAVSDCSSLYLLAIFSSSSPTFPVSNGSSASPPLLPAAPSRALNHHHQHPHPQQHRQLLLWSVAVPLSTLTYLLAGGLLLMLLYLHGYYDAVALPPLTIQSLVASVHTTTTSTTSGSATKKVATSSSSSKSSNTSGTDVTSTRNVTAAAAAASAVPSKTRPYDSTSSTANQCIASSLIVQQLKKETSPPEPKKKQEPQTMSKVIRLARFRQEQEKGKGTATISGTTAATLGKTQQ